MSVSKRALIALFVTGTAIVLWHYGWPMLLKHEGTKPGGLNTLNTALWTYKTSHGHYPQTLATLGREGLIDTILASGKKSGYEFTYRLSKGPAAGLRTHEGYTINADPIDNSTQGQPHYFTDESLTIRVRIDLPATANDSPVSEK